MLENPTESEQRILNAISYQPNKVILHSDENFMQKNRNTWSSWVYIASKNNSGASQLSLSYWMNNLQGLDTANPLIVTLNPDRRPKEDLIYDEHSFAHPVFDQKAIDAQARIDEIQGINDVYFCGAWQRYGFHEDGLLSAVNVAKKMGADIPWEE
jgi:predicted NAD/FAD-binding protein